MKTVAMRDLLRCVLGSFVISYICYVHSSTFNMRLVDGLAPPRSESGGSPSPLLISVCPKTSVLRLIYFRPINGPKLPKDPVRTINLAARTASLGVVRIFFRFPSPSVPPNLLPNISLRRLLRSGQVRSTCCTVWVALQHSLGFLSHNCCLYPGCER